MKEKDLWLSAEELQHMLQGSLHWMDVEPRMGTSRTGIRKIGATVREKDSVSFQPLLAETEQGEKKERSSKRLEGKPVILLLGSVGLLTLSSWFYFFLFSK
jgi:hypothetical protein